MSNETSRREVQHAFRARGVTIAAWAQAHGFSASLVYAVLSGRAKGYRGQANEIARALRLVSTDSGSDERFAWLDSASVGGKSIRFQDPEQEGENFEVRESTNG